MKVTDNAGDRNLWVIKQFEFIDSLDSSLLCFEKSIVMLAQPPITSSSVLLMLVFIPFSFEPTEWPRVES